MEITKELLLQTFPLANNLTIKQLNFIVKYQDKFHLNLTNIKCINPNCNNLKKVSTTVDGLNHCCSPECKIIMKKEIKQLLVQKTKQTCLLNYGVENPNQSNIIKERTKQNNLIKYGYESSNSVPEIKAKQKAAIIEKYGYTTALQHPEVKEKLKQNNFKKYGTNYKTQYHIKNYKFWFDKSFIQDNFFINNRFDIYNFMDFFNVNDTNAYKKLRDLNIKYNKRSNISIKEFNILNYLKYILPSENIKNNIKDIIKVKNRYKELDIYLPELNVAIEYNGIYWHSIEAGKDKYYHQQKALACLEQGIRLLHLYEDQTEEEQYSLIDKFLINEYDIEATTFSLDNGCYPNNVEAEILEPEARTVLKDRTLYNAGQIKLK